MSAQASDVSQRETALFLEAVPVFSELPEEHLHFLSGLCGKVHLPAGETLFAEGDPGDAVFVIRRGVLEVFSHFPNGDELVLARLSSHELIGEHYILDGGGGRRSASVRAAAPSDLIRISHDSFDRLLKRNPMVAEHLAARRAQRERENLARRSELYRIISGQVVDAPGKLVRFEAGAVVFREGEPGNAVYLITAGSAEAYLESRPQVALNELSVGQCFGERAVMSDSPRTASVRAKSALEVLVIPAAQFVSLHQQSAELAAMVRGLEFNYHLPNRGHALQFTARREGEESIERLYRLPDRRQFLSSYLIRRQVFRIERTDVPRGPHLFEIVWRDAEAGLERCLRIAPTGEIHSLVAGGQWDLLPRLIEAALDAVPISEESLRQFAQSGELPLEAVVEDSRDAGVLDEEVVCACLGIKAARLHGLMDAGFRSFEALRGQTGCGSVCGGCETRVCDMIQPPGWTDASASARALSPDVRVFCLTPAPGQTYPEWLPGQHLLLAGRIRGQWVSRAYLISSAPNSRQLEITVQRQPRGLFSRWLFDGPAEEKQLRISAPRGAEIWRNNERPTVCLAFEMGVALPLAIVRAAIAEGSFSPIHIELAARSAQRLARLDELKSLARNHAGITLNTTFGELQPRKRRALAQGLRERYRDAEFYLCSTARDTGCIAEHLMKAGVAESRIHEVLFNMGGPEEKRGRTSIWSRWGVRGLVVAALVVIALVVVSKSARGW